LRITRGKALSRTPAGLLNDLPYDLAGLCRVVQGLAVHYRLGQLFDLEIPE
jgi:hypothetical protein